MRLFVGLALPSAVLDDLDAACAPFRPLRDDLRWTSREAWHITLAFLGEVTDLSLTRLMPRLERAARRHDPFSLSLADAGAFPSAARANVLWSGLAGDRRALGDLAASVGAAARRAGAPPPDAGRRFRPHLTLARFKTEDGLARLREEIKKFEPFEFGSMCVSEFYLFQSELGRRGAKYTKLASFPLRGDT